MATPEPGKNTSRINELAWTNNRNKLENAELYGRAVGKQVGDSAKQFYTQAKGSLPEGLAPETFMNKIIRPIITAFTEYIMENYLTNDNIETATKLMEKIMTDFISRLNDIAEENKSLEPVIDKLKDTIAKSISREARKTVPTDNQMEGGKRRKKYTKKRYKKRY